VGLFGTVWGIMNSFFQIGMQQNSSLAVVAPGISEALFATAIGLFAAIPAVIAYNRFSPPGEPFEARLQRFADKVHAQVSRELEGPDGDGPPRTDRAGAAGAASAARRWRKSTSRRLST
jgi:biopolymer transport protein TolQ